ncbi:MAG: hypothetical protein M1831_001233 [Alyxoria varia]|nr:MAG: hypothetical protein M1831_001233 [Alyxoria varia]
MSSTPRKFSDNSRPPVTPPSARSSRYPQTTPHHEPSRRQNTNPRPTPRRSSTSSSIAGSIGGTLDTASPKAAGQVNEQSQNAISTLLSPPIVRTGLVPQSSLPTSSGYRPPTSRDIPPVSLTSIPHIDSSAFKTYLSQVGPLFESFQRAKAASEETSAQLQTPRTENEDEFSEMFGRQLRKGSAASVPSSARRSSAMSPIEPQSPAQRTLRGRGGPAPLSSIPKVYFEENFRLENPRIFDVVSEYADIIPAERPSARDVNLESGGSATPPPQPKRKALHTNAILQEKLSWYMDTVELHLISSIATASTSFFAALGSLKELEAEAAASIQEIKSLRSSLQKLDKDVALGGLEVVNTRRRRENIRKLLATVDQLCEIVEEAKKCEDLVEEGEVEAATTRIDRLENIICGKNNEDEEVFRADLRRVQALAGVSEGISSLRSRIGKGFESRFMSTLLTDLREHVHKVPAADTLKRWADASLRTRSGHVRSRSAVPAYLHDGDKLRLNLLGALSGLSRASHISRAATAYREAIMREIKSMIRDNLPSADDDDAESTTSVSTRGGRRLNRQEKSSLLARNLRALDIDAAEELLVMVYTAVGEALRRLGFQVKVLLDVTSSMEPPARRGSDTSESRSEASNQIDQIRVEVTQALDLSSLLGQGVDLIQTQVTKVLKVRGEQNTRLPLEYFLRYFMLNRLLADECEAVSSRSGDALKDVVNTQVKEFLQIMAEAEKQHINRALESDRWDAKDFGPNETVVLDRVLESMTSTPPAWLTYTSLWEPSVNGTTSTTQINGDTPSTERSQTRSAQIDSQKYFLVNSMHSALQGIVRFQQLIATIPTLAPDASTHLLTYLKFISSRAYQMVLGAGAMKTAGLKTITIKHLALASQACSFIIALIPYVREFVRRHLPSGGSGSAVLGDFDKTKRIFQDHQTSIHEKVVEIMGGTSTAHVATMRKVDFDKLGSELQEKTGAADEATPPSQWVEKLAKDTGTMNRVLSRHVSEIDLKMIMTPIFEEYRSKLREALREAPIRTEEGKSCLLNDVRALRTHFAKLDTSAGELGDELVKVVNEKQVGGAGGPASGASGTSRRGLGTQPPRSSQESSSARPQGSRTNSTNDTSAASTTRPAQGQREARTSNSADESHKDQDAQKDNGNKKEEPSASVKEDAYTPANGTASTADTSASTEPNTTTNMSTSESKTRHRTKSSVDMLGRSEMKEEEEEPDSEPRPPPVPDKGA